MLWCRWYLISFDLLIEYVLWYTQLLPVNIDLRAFLGKAKVHTWSTQVHDRLASGTKANLQPGCATPSCRPGSRSTAGKEVNDDAETEFRTVPLRKLIVSHHPLPSI